MIPDGWDELTAWFLAATPPEEPIRLATGVTLTEPLKAWAYYQARIKTGEHRDEVLWFIRAVKAALERTCHEGKIRGE